MVRLGREEMGVVCALVVSGAGVDVDKSGAGTGVGVDGSGVAEDRVGVREISGRDVLLASRTTRSNDVSVPPSSKIMSRDSKKRPEGQCTRR